MPSEEIRFWLDVIASLVGVFALGGIALEFQRARRADTREFMYEMLEKSSDIEYERQFVDGLAFHSLEEFVIATQDPKVAHAWRKVYNFWSVLAGAAKENAISKNLVIRSWGITFLAYYEKFEDLFTQIDTLGGYEFNKDVRWFAEEVRRTAPDAIKGNEFWKSYVAQVLAEVSQR